MPKPPSGRLTIAQAKQAALTAAQHEIATVNFHLPEGMDEAAFAKTMQAITQALINAWCAGYAAAGGGLK